MPLDSADSFDSERYGATVSAILALDGMGHREMPLANGAPVNAGLDGLGKHSSNGLFPGAFSPDGALSGLYLYFCGYDRAHEISQDLPTAEGSFWHGILHRQEPDPGNASYWFRRVGDHAVFPALAEQAEAVGYGNKTKWDPFRFIDYCESARMRPGSKEEQLARRVQLAEWQLLFDYCARPAR